MAIRGLSRKLAAVASVFVLFFSVVASADPTSQPTTSPSTAPFVSKKASLSVAYGTAWKAMPSRDDVLLLVPCDAAKDDDRNITIDEPFLPPHLPWMVTLAKVEKGYLDDLKKRHPDLQVQDDYDQPLPECKGKFVRCTWTVGSKHEVEASVLFIHNDHVYLFTLDTDAPHYDASRGIFDGVVGSLKWEKKN